MLTDDEMRSLRQAAFPSYLNGAFDARLAEYGRAVESAVLERLVPVAWVDQKTFDELSTNPHGALAYHRWLGVGAEDYMTGRTIPLYAKPRDIDSEGK